MATGVIKTINFDRNFGFVRGDDGVEAFFHASDAPDFSELFVDDRVTYALADPPPPKGPRARSVHRVA